MISLSLAILALFLCALATLSAAINSSPPLMFWFYICLTIVPVIEINYLLSPQGWTERVSDERGEGA